MSLPIEPARSAVPAPRAQGRFFSSVDTFAVEEVPLYTPQGEGEHLWLWIEKRGLSSWAACERLAEALAVRAEDFGMAGMKDKNATTRQWLSVPGVDPERAAGLELEGLRVLEATRHGNKIKLGHLAGNRFSVTLPDVPDAEREGLRKNLRWLEKRGLPNAFGAQRFGSGGRNVGKGIAALEGRSGSRRMPKKLLRLLVSAVQSEIFNRVLAARIGEVHELRDGDVAWIHSNGACFLVEDGLGERIRAEAFEISPSGPLWGKRMLAPQGEVATIEHEARESVGVTAEQFAALPRNLCAGARRPLRVRVRDARVEDLPDGGVRLHFGLPPGSYATTLLGELLEAAPWTSSGASRS